MVLIIIVLVLLIPLLAILLDSHLGRALAARVERRPLTPGEDVTQERIALLEGEVERLGSELGRLEEESQFLHRLLTERAGESEDRGLLPGSDVPVKGVSSAKREDEDLASG